MVCLILLLVFIFLLTALLMMPIHIRINQGGDCLLTDNPFFLRLIIDLNANSLAAVILYVFFIRFTWFPLQKDSSKPVKEKMPPAEKKFELPNWNRLKFLLTTGWHILKHSKVNKFYLYLDTGNVIVNANLFPVFELINERPRINLNINYSGNFALCLDVQNNIGNILGIFFYSLIKRIFTLTKNKLYGIQSR
jgi:hypothetical protein